MQIRFVLGRADQQPVTVAAITELCPGCFADKGNVSLCPHCGYDQRLKRRPLVLAHRTLLHYGQYVIGRDRQATINF